MSQKTIFILQRKFLILLFCLFYIHYSCKNYENDVKQKLKEVIQGPLKKWTELKKLPIVLGEKQKNPDNFRLNQYIS